MVMIEFTLLERFHPWEGEVSSSDLTFHHVRQGKRPTITPSKLSGPAEDVKHDWLITIKKSLHQDPGKPLHSHCYSSIREYDNQRGPSERFVQRYKERVYKGVRLKIVRSMIIRELLSRAQENLPPPFMNKKELQKTLNKNLRHVFDIWMELMLVSSSR